MREHCEFLLRRLHVAVHRDEPLDEKIVGCLTCETIIGLSEEYRLAEIFVEFFVEFFCRMQWLFCFQNYLVTDACECFVQMCVCGYLKHNHGRSGRTLWPESSPRMHGLGRSPRRVGPCAYSGLIQP